MKFLPLDRMLTVVDNARDDSDMALFMHLLYLGEMLTKCIVAGMVATVVDGRQRNRYSAIHKLVRADGLGDWVMVLDEILTGPTSQFLTSASNDLSIDLVKRCSKGTWQYEAVALLHQGLSKYGIQDLQDFPVKTDLRRWFRLFTELRNKSRAHGAPQSGKCADVCNELESSIHIIIDNFSLFKKPWAFLHRNYSGKYRVTKLTDDVELYKYLKSSGTKDLPNLQDGVYMYLDEPRLVELVISDPEAFDFFFPNGQFTDKKFELISYITDAKSQGDANLYLLPPTDLPESETEGRGILDQQGNCFGNLPPVPEDYISRPLLEEELSTVLLEKDRRPIVTLVGRGGIGKTWLALNVLHKLSDNGRFVAIIWFSARDIDLLINGPKRVKPHVLDEKDIANEFARLLEPSESKAHKSFNSLDFLSENLKKSRIGPALFVFDNFETVKNPVELYTYLDTYLRLPNKVLITTRFREFKADFPVEVSGMTEKETEILIQSTATHLGIADLLTDKYKEEIYQESDGHPYVIKILLGEVAKAGSLVKIERIVADSEEILRALFERTYARLSPVAKRVFLNSL